MTGEEIAEQQIPILSARNQKKQKPGEGINIPRLRYQYNPPR